MPKCKDCGDEVEELVVVVSEGKKRRVCEDCAEELAAGDNIAKESEAVVQQMMGFKGRR